MTCRIQCNHHGATLTFHVDAGSNAYYFAVLVKYGNGDGELAGVDLKQALDAHSWLPMQPSWGALWKLNSGSSLQAPFSIRLKSLQSGKTIVAKNVIPADWKPGQAYPSHVNFNS